MRELFVLILCIALIMISCDDSTTKTKNDTDTISDMDVVEPDTDSVEPDEDAVTPDSEPDAENDIDEIEPDEDVVTPDSELDTEVDGDSVEPDSEPDEDFVPECEEGETKTGTGKISTCKNGRWKIVRQTVMYGAESGDYGFSTAVDKSGNIYASGWTDGDVDGDGSGTNLGSYDVFVVKFDSAGSIQWIKQFGTESSETVGYSSLALDNSGNIYVTGYTLGDIDGDGSGTNLGSSDVFIVKLNSTGEIKLAKQFGSAGADFQASLAVDGTGNIYIGGYTEGNIEGTNAGYDDAFVAKLNASGEVQWVKQLGTTRLDRAEALGVDSSGNVYAAGFTIGDIDGDGAGTNLGNKDAFIVKYDASGELKWIKQFGTDTVDENISLAIDKNDKVYVTGTTQGDIDGEEGSETNAGITDIFVVKFDSDGTVLMAREFGTEGQENMNSVAVADSGNIYFTGLIYEGDMTGSCGGTGFGHFDVFVLKLDTAGVFTPIMQYGSSFEDRGNSIALDSNENIYISGYTKGAFDSLTNAGEADAFLSIIPAE